MILELVLQIKTETNDEIIFQYGTHYLLKRKDSLDYEKIKLSEKEIIALKKELQLQVKKLLDETIKEV